LTKCLDFLIFTIRLNQKELQFFKSNIKDAFKIAHPFNTLKNLKSIIMKTKFTFLTLLFVSLSLALQSTVWRVNNRPNVDADFTTLQAAINGASATDTIYLEGSPTNYGTGSLNKQLTIIGAGYFLNQNDSTQAYKESSKVSTLFLYNGSQGSVIEGLEISISTYSNIDGVNIQTNNIKIRRNYISVTTTSASSWAAAFRFSSNVDNLTIEQNWINANSPTAGHAQCIFTNSYFSNSIIRNNIIYADTNQYAVSYFTANEAASLIFSNNVIMGRMTTNYSSHYNNIILWSDYTPGTGDINSNNLCDETQYPNVNSNQQNVDMTTVFVDYTSYIDNGYILATGSPAIGTGVGGDDCGAFGTGDPYVLSGMPPIPAIFEVETTQSIGTSTLPVTIKAKSHN
jgi:hypothetical protein